jgi:hypothetical protein
MVTPDLNDMAFANDDLGNNEMRETAMLRNLLLGTVLAIGFATAASAATMQFTAALDGKSEVPPKTGSGFGNVLATLDTNTKTLSYTLTFQGLSGPATAAHFHGPAAEGANAGVAVPIAKDPASPVTGNATLTDAQMADLEAGKWYANVHTAANPGGEIRGQMKPVKAR